MNLKTKILSLALSATVFAASLTGCGTTGTTTDLSADSSAGKSSDVVQTSGSVLNVSISADPDSFDPAVSLSGDSA